MPLTDSTGKCRVHVLGSGVPQPLAARAQPAAAIRTRPRGRGAASRNGRGDQHPHGSHDDRVRGQGHGRRRPGEGATWGPRDVSMIRTVNNKSPEGRP